MQKIGNIMFTIHLKTFALYFDIIHQKKALKHSWKMLSIVILEIFKKIL